MRLGLAMAALSSASENCRRPRRKRVLEVGHVKRRPLGEGAAPDQGFDRLAYIGVDLVEGDADELGNVGIEAVATRRRMAVGQASGAGQGVAAYRLLEDAAQTSSIASGVGFAAVTDAPAVQLAVAVEQQPQVRALGVEVAVAGARAQGFDEGPGRPRGGRPRLARRRARRGPPSGSN